jgi:hypothetical protein
MQDFCSAGPASKQLMAASLFAVNCKLFAVFRSEAFQNQWQREGHHG